VNGCTGLYRHLAVEPAVAVGGTREQMATAPRVTYTPPIGTTGAECGLEWDSRRSAVSSTRMLP